MKFIIHNFQVPLLLFRAAIFIVQKYRKFVMIFWELCIENDEGFEDVRKFKASNNTYNGLERYLNKGVHSARSVSRMGRLGSQLQTSCSSLASSTGSVTPSDLTNTLLSASRGNKNTIITVLVQY